jgi:hypothetical protein
MIVNDRFHFLTTDVFAAADHHVFCTIRNEDETRLIHVANVAGADPAVAQRFFRCVRFVPVTAEIHRSLDPDLAGFSARQFNLCIVDDFDFDERRNRPPATARPVSQIDAGNTRSEPIRFRHAVTGTGYAGFQLFRNLTRVLGAMAGRAATMDLSDRTSNLEKFGDCTISHDMVGTPLNDVIRSASMMRSASSGSHLYMPTSFRPGRNDEFSCTFKPVTWNSGTVRIMDGQNSGF